MPPVTRLLASIWRATPVQSFIRLTDNLMVKNLIPILRRVFRVSTRGSIVFLVFLTGWCCWANESTNEIKVSFIRFTNAQHLFSLVLPEDWRLMDASRAKSLLDTVRSGSYTNVASFGYIPPVAGTNDGASSSYIAVHVVHSRRWAPGTLTVLEHPEFRQTGALLRLGSEGVRPEDIVSTTFHPQNLVLRTDYKFKDEEGVEFKAIDCSIFTERGVVDIACVAKAGEYEAVKTRFDRALSSFDLHPSLRYQAGPSVAAVNTQAAQQARSQMRYIPFLALAIWCFFKWRASRVMSDEV